MAILFMEGFDGYADLNEMFDDNRIGFLFGVEAASNYTLGTGRSGSGKSLQIANEEGEVILSLSQSSSDTIWVQCGFQTSSMTDIDQQRIFRLYSVDGIEGTLFADAVSGALDYRRGDYNGTQLATGGSVSAGSWHFIELKVYLHDTNGTVLVKVDGTEVINATGLDTLANTASIASVVVGGTPTSDAGDPDFYFDDVVIGDDSDGGGGSPTNVATDLLGDCSIEVLYPDGAGNYAQWTPSAGSNFQNVDEGATHDSDTTYNSSSTAAQKDSFTCDNLSVTSGTVHAVQISTVAKKGDGGGRLLKGLVRSGGVDATGNGKYVPAAYAQRSEIFERDPSGNDWTVSSVNSMEIGYELGS